MKKLKEVYPAWSTTGGILTDITSQFSSVPWGQDLDLSKAMDLEYYGNRSGQKSVSPLINNMITGDILSTAERASLAKTVYYKFQRNWLELYKVITIQYDPITNYNMTETEEIEGSTSSSATAADTTSTNDNTQVTTEGFLYGFNSGSASSSDKQTQEKDSTVGVNSDSTASNSGSSSSDRTLTRSGNIGVTTSQQMLQSHIDLYTEYNFWNAVFTDIDSVITSGFWED